MVRVCAFECDDISEVHTTFVFFSHLFSYRRWRERGKVISTDEASDRAVSESCICDRGDKHGDVPASSVL